MTHLQAESQDRCLRMASRLGVLNAQGRHLATLKAEIEKCYARACARSIVEETAFQDEREVKKTICRHGVCFVSPSRPHHRATYLCKLC